MTLQEALEVVMPSGKRLASATLFEIYECGVLWGSSDKLMQALEILGSHDYRFPLGDQVLH